MKKHNAVKKRLLGRALKDVHPESPLAHFIEHNVDQVLREAAANDETRKAIERANDIERARCAAAYIRAALKYFAQKSGTSDEMCRAINVGAKEAWFIAGMHICASQDTAGILRLVADALEGKLRPAAKGDDEIHEAYGKAIRTGKRCHERTIWFMPFPSEVYEAFDKGPDVHWSRPSKDALSRRLKILGLPLSEKPGARRKTPQK
jgi:hypothetical protein